ncbi:hypothetical protein K523DRAFT_266910 [Schizophyllum commune Tattone D]|nr:hypothetical protein K523DRAFT_266910 [Schizophyllum commune Tattone D]
MPRSSTAPSSGLYSAGAHRGDALGLKSSPPPSPLQAESEPLLIPASPRMRPASFRRVSSPLNPDTPPASLSASLASSSTPPTQYSPPSTSPPPPGSPFRSRPSLSNFSYVPSEEARVLSGQGSATGTPRTSMILYHFALPDGEASRKGDAATMPPPLIAPTSPRDSLASLTRPISGIAFPRPESGTGSDPSTTSRSSMISYSSDSKYPMLSHSSDSKYLTMTGGLVPYAYDPDDDLLSPLEEGAVSSKEDGAPIPTRRFTIFSWRGLANAFALAILMMALIALFVLYPVLAFSHDGERSWRIAHNTAINATGQAA